ncbi:MAG TPA: hypothetical protein VLB50_03845 [Ignavibacteriaceae bacterium]|nr:hypothetical protein [Ignavibacteriaceae bacterium]
MWQAWFNLLISGGLIICAFVDRIRNEISMILAGILLIITGLWGAGRGNSWQDMSICFIGFVLFFMVSFDQVNTLAFLITGVLSLVITFWDLIQHPHPNQNI